MTKISLIGAGSTVFARTLLSDIFSFPELANAAITLFDIDPARLATSEAMAHKLAASLRVQPGIQATTDRQRALDGADYAISMIQVGGYKPATVVDFEIPKKYDLRQTIGDTLGIGGIFRALRTIPVLLDICQDMERLCPDVTFLQYANPMAMNCLAIGRATRVRTVGLCHSVQGTAQDLARQVGVPPGELNYVCAGINHMAFYLRLEHQGRDLYPLLRQVIRYGRVPAWDRVRYDFFQRFGYFVTESTEHFSEYVPWYIKRDRPDLIERYHIPLDEYPARCEDQIAGWALIEQALAGSDEAFSDRLDASYNEFQNERLAQRDPALAAYRRAEMAKGKSLSASGPHRSNEYGALIIHSIETGAPAVINGNVLNDRLIDNLPDDCCVEVPCVVDRNGVQPVRIGRLPTPLAALIQTNVNVQELTVEAALTLRRDRIYQAALLDPHTAAELDPDQIYALVDELIAAHGDWLPTYE